MPVAFTPWMKYSGPIAPPTSDGFTPLLGRSPGALTSTFGAGPEVVVASGANADVVGVPVVSAVPPWSGELAVVTPGEVLSTAGVATAALAAPGNAAKSAQARTATLVLVRIMRPLHDRGILPRTP